MSAVLWAPNGQTGEEVIRTELFNILSILYSLDRKQEWQMLSTFTRYDLVAELIAMEVMFREIVLGVCRLADSDPGTWSLHAVWKNRNAEIERITARRVRAALKDYGDAVEPWKTEVRHKRIAHYSKADPDLSQKIADIRAVVGMAVKSFDLILGMRQEYHLRVGSQEKIINLREVIEERGISVSG